MLERDYLMRQIQQMVRVLQQVLFQKQQGRVEEAHRTIQQAIGELDERGDGNLRHRSLREVIRFCRRDGAFRADFAMHLADVLNVEGDLLAEQGNVREGQKSHARALLLYRRAMQEENAAFPLDAGAKLNTLEAKLPADAIDAIETVLSE